ncbi:Transcriptional regulatory protein sin3 [Haplosporangium sp. Z 11]|nr:Transcriptional regulatory protein sin3 [Haplosporangium sp. Z 11]
MNTPRDSTSDQDDANASASFAHSLAVAPLDTANTIHNISLALNSGTEGVAAVDAANTDTDVLMTDVTNAVQDNIAAMDQQAQLDQPLSESRMAVAELLVSLAHPTRATTGSNQQDGTAAYVSAAAGILAPKQHSPIYKNAVDYVGSVKKAYENNPRIYTEFLSALEQYHGLSLPIDQLVRTVMTLFQDQPELLLGFKEFLPEAQGLLNQLVPPMMYSDYKGNAVKAPAATTAVATTTASLPEPDNHTIIPTALLAQPVVGVQQTTQQQGNINQILNNGHAAADFLSMIKELSQQEPDMYQHMITLLRKFQKDHSYANLYFYVSIILRYHPHLLQRFHKFLPTVTSGVEVTEPRIISKAPPEELVVSPDFIEAKDFVQTVKVYSEVSLIFWNHPDALAGFKQFISSVPPAPQS